MKSYLAKGWQPEINGAAYPELFATKQLAVDRAIQVAEQQKIGFARIDATYIELDITADELVKHIPPEIPHGLN